MCSSTNSNCELTNETPGTASAVSFSFIRNASLVSSRHVERVAPERTRPRGLHRIGGREHHLARRQRGVGARNRHRLLGEGTGRRRVDAMARGEPPGAVDQHAQAHAVARRARDVLHLPLAGRDRLTPVAIDADVGVGGAQLRRLRERHIRGFGAQPHRRQGPTGRSRPSQARRCRAARTVPEAMNSRRETVEE